MSIFLIVSYALIHFNNISKLITDLVSYHVGIFYDQFRKREYEAALESLLRAGLIHIPSIQMNLAAVFAELGNESAAQAAIARLLELRPGFTIKTAEQEYRDKRNFEPDFAEQLISSLREAGLSD